MKTPLRRRYRTEHLIVLVEGYVGVPRTLALVLVVLVVILRRVERLFRPRQHHRVVLLLLDHLLAQMLQHALLVLRIALLRRLRDDLEVAELGLYLQRHVGRLPHLMLNLLHVSHRRLRHFRDGAVVWVVAEHLHKHLGLPDAVLLSCGRLLITDAAVKAQVQLARLKGEVVRHTRGHGSRAHRWPNDRVLRPQHLRRKVGDGVRPALHFALAHLLGGINLSVAWRVQVPKDVRCRRRLVQAVDANELALCPLVRICISRQVQLLEDLCQQADGLVLSHLVEVDALVVVGLH